MKKIALHRVGEIMSNPGPEARYFAPMACPEDALETAGKLGIHAVVGVEGTYTGLIFDSKEDMWRCGFCGRPYDHMAGVSGLIRECTR